MRQFITPLLAATALVLSSGPASADLGGNDDVGLSDLLVLLANWGRVRERMA